MTRGTCAPDPDGVDILLVDDRQEDLMALTAVLEGRGYNLVTAQSGAEALRRVLEHDFALILVDVLMPVMDGFELAAAIKSRDRTRATPLIFLTADASDVDKIYRAYSIGAVDYLQKPIQPSVVRAKVAVFAELFRKDRRLRLQSEALREADHREQALKLAELRLAADRRYRNLAEAIPQIVFIVSPQGTFQYANRRWTEYTGIHLAQASEPWWTSAVHRDDVDRCRIAWQRAVAAGSEHATQCRLRRADGAYRWHLCRAVPERGADGSVERWLGTYSDVEDLKQAIDARDQFLAVASHELRTPITALRLRLQSMLRDPALVNPPRTRAERSLRQVDQLNGLIDRLLDVSRITTGNLQIEPERLDLVELVRETAQRFDDQLLQHSTQIALTADESITGDWDRMRLEQVLTNLLSNAVRHSNGQPIEVGVHATETAVELSVRDHGPGIAEVDRERIFERFERADSDRAGLGVGLFITRQIVERHGGSIRASSADGAGAEFRVLLPRHMSTFNTTTVVANEQGPTCDHSTTAVGSLTVSNSDVGRAGAAVVMVDVEANANDSAWKTPNCCSSPHTTSG
jgi:PAS domain S-box-containing protein